MAVSGERTRSRIVRPVVVAATRWRRRHAVAPPACRLRRARERSRNLRLAAAAAGMRWRRLAAVSGDRTQSRTHRPVAAGMRWRRLAAATDERKDAEEHVDDVEVEVEGGEDVLLGRQRVLVLPPQHHLRVEDEVLPTEGTRQRREDSGIRSAFFLTFFKIEKINYFGGFFSEVFYLFIGLLLFSRRFSSDLLEYFYRQVSFGMLDALPKKFEYDQSR